ncbi:MAG: M23 family metallopeptidase [Nocardioides sp.]
MSVFSVLVASLVLALSSTPAVPPHEDPIGTWPLRPDPEVIEHFDPPTSPYAAGHRGVDLLGADGQPVHAALPGRVTYAGPLAGIGVIVIEHGSTRTTYQPIDASVAVGDDVTAGARVGTLDRVGSHCPPRPCLHWGWIDGETYLDPLRLVGAGPVRLLPLWREEPFGSAPALPASTSPSAGALASGVAHQYASWRPLLQVLGLA